MKQHISTCGTFRTFRVSKYLSTYVGILCMENHSLYRHYLNTYTYIFAENCSIYRTFLLIIGCLYNMFLQSIIFRKGSEVSHCSGLHINGNLVLFSILINLFYYAWHDSSYLPFFLLPVASHFVA